MSDPLKPSKPGGSADPARQSGVEDLKAAHDAREDLDRTIEAGKAKARKIGKEAEKAASDALLEAGRQAKGFGEEQKERAADRIGGMASALRSAAGDLDRQHHDVIADYTRQAAAGLDSVSGAISGQGLDDLVGTVEDFARRQPAAFLGGAVLSGFLLARFAKSSSERRMADDPYRPGTRPSTAADIGADRAQSAYSRPAGATDPAAPRPAYKETH